MIITTISQCFRTVFNIPLLSSPHHFPLGIFSCSDNLLLQVKLHLISWGGKGTIKETLCSPESDSVAVKNANWQ